MKLCINIVQSTEKYIGYFTSSSVFIAAQVKPLVTASLFTALVYFNERYYETSLSLYFKCDLDGMFCKST